jgi:hypothetical protein
VEVLLCRRVVEPGPTERTLAWTSLALSSLSSLSQAEVEM